MPAKPLRVLTLALFLLAGCRAVEKPGYRGIATGFAVEIPVIPGIFVPRVEVHCNVDEKDLRYMDLDARGGADRRDSL